MMAEGKVVGKAEGRFDVLLKIVALCFGNFPTKMM